IALDRAQPDAQPLSSVDELVGFFRAAERPTARHWVGLEHEKFIYPSGSTEPVPYEGERGISAVLKGLQAFRFQPFRERPSGPVIALTRGKSTISLVPGGQFELSCTPAPTAPAVNQVKYSHFNDVKTGFHGIVLRL